MATHLREDSDCDRSRLLNLSFEMDERRKKGRVWMGVGKNRRFAKLVNFALSGIFFARIAPLGHKFFLDRAGLCSQDYG